jgi:hypothetical protein
LVILAILVPLALLDYKDTPDRLDILDSRVISATSVPQDYKDTLA